MPYLPAFAYVDRALLVRLATIVPSTLSMNSRAFLVHDRTFLAPWSYLPSPKVAPASDIFRHRAFPRSNAESYLP